MANDFLNMKIEGVEDLMKAFDQLSPSLNKKVMTSILRKASRPIKAEAEMQLSSHKVTGNLLKSIKISTKLKGSQKTKQTITRGGVTVYVGSSARHAHLFEFGSAPREQKKTKRFTGQMPAQPFLRPAWDAKRKEALDYISKNIWNEVLRAVKRLRTRAEAGKLSKSEIRDLET